MLHTLHYYIYTIQSQPEYGGIDIKVCQLYPTLGVFLWYRGEILEFLLSLIPFPEQTDIKTFYHSHVHVHDHVNVHVRARANVHVHIARKSKWTWIRTWTRTSNEHEYRIPDKSLIRHPTYICSIEFRCFQSDIGGSDIRPAQSDIAHHDIASDWAQTSESRWSEF